MVNVAHEKTFPRFLSLEELRKSPYLSNMVLLQKGNRLSVQPVTEKEFKVICKLATEKQSLHA